MKADESAERDFHVFLRDDSLVGFYSAPVDFDVDFADGFHALKSFHELEQPLIQIELTRCRARLGTYTRLESEVRWP